MGTKWSKWIEWNIREYFESWVLNAQMPTPKCHPNDVSTDGLTSFLFLESCSLTTWKTAIKLTVLQTNKQEKQKEKKMGNKSSLP